MDGEEEQNVFSVKNYSAQIWENNSLYYSIQSDDPSLKDCAPTILRTEIVVSGKENHAQ